MSMANNLLEIWGLYNSKVLNEKAPAAHPPGKKAVKMSTKPGPGPVLLNDPKAGAIGRKDSTGPEAADNFDGPSFNRSISDLKTMTDKDKKDKPYVAQLNVSVENFDKNLEKTTKAAINNNMKSTFDKLFEEVMNSEDDKDLVALGVDADAPEGDMEGDVTITLSPDHVEVLRAILAQVDGSSDEGMDDESMPDDDMGTDEDAEMKMPKHGDEDYEAMHPEGTEMEEVKDSVGLAMTKHSNMKVGDVTAKHDVGANKAGTTTIDVPVDGKVKNVPDSAGLALTKHSNNKPHSKIKGNNQLAYGIK